MVVPQSSHEYGEHEMVDKKYTHETLKPGTYVEVLSKKQVDGKNLCGTIITAAPDDPGTYVVEYHPGLGNGHHSENELQVIPRFLCQHSTPRPF